MEQFTPTQHNNKKFRKKKKKYVYNLLWQSPDA
jgi:hypothetical protein